MESGRLHSTQRCQAIAETNPVDMSYHRLHIIRFEPSGRSSVVSTGVTILEGARRSGIELASNCSGQGDCGQCGVIILEGEVSALCEEEENCLSQDRISANWRLACCARVNGPIRVYIPR